MATNTNQQQQKYQLVSGIQQTAGAGTLPQFSMPVGTTRSPSPSKHLQVAAGTSAKRSPSPSTHLQLTPRAKRSPSPSMNLQLSASSTGGLDLQGSTSHSSLVVVPPAPKRKKICTRELRYMMHGFGDDPTPYSETVDLVEDLVIDFITEMTLRAMEIGKKGKVHVEDIIFLIRKDPKKYARVKELLMMNEELKKARKDFTDLPD